MKLIFFFIFSPFILCCNATQSSNGPKKTSLDYANTITAKDLKKHLYIYAGDEMEGRMTGSKGQKMAAEYIRDFYKKEGISAARGTNDYFQDIPASFFAGRRDPQASENVVAFIKGSEKPEEIVVISAHLDHVGMDKEGNVFNGADDDGSGTVSILEIAQAFHQAVKDGHPPKRSILFLHVTGEEIGLYGSRYYTENPLFPLKNTVCDLNIDMIGRIDPDKKDNPDYIYLIGSNKLSQELQDISTAVNDEYTKLELDYKYDDPNDSNRFYYRSDHYNFAKNNVPIIFYFNGVHEDYHKITDTPDKIEYDLMAKRAQLIFLTAWEVANRDQRIKVD
ncbi:M28 family metallopeptidase [Aequorivita antarctica]|uniref:M28 family peptidase n=1 Tax=Aequorivita antarctica TaxID=153266 RepID=A0A5C6YX97_9FLAO|nr:M28 family metallopeptidase [Aequorivita antarctica]TXD71867.1 M28 family peptidase [Aequorivita antarctica]SRX75446.1 Bacterial leucyl aminopeptidase [Aequorivita antarctica]